VEKYNRLVKKEDTAASTLDKAKALFEKMPSDINALKVQAAELALQIASMELASTPVPAMADSAPALDASENMPE
jgi:predicted  nucleic acid-binding Zn-ribbon protein